MAVERYPGESLINTRGQSPRQQEGMLASWQARDYHDCDPYPMHAFGPQQWPLNKGPRPTPLPLPKILVEDLAEFVFRNGSPTFSIGQYPEAEEFLRTIVENNSLDAQWVPLAVDTGIQGAILCKFSVDMDNEENPIKLTFLDIPQEARAWVDPHDVNNILMVRIQYPYRDIEDGKWYYYREEWTSEEYITYHPVECGESTIAVPRLIPGYVNALGDNHDEWVIKDRIENEFGLIPAVIIRNKMMRGNPVGEGDCWKIFRIIDRIALTMHGEDRANQLHSEPVRVATNARMMNEDQMLPGETVEILQENPEGGPPRFELVEPTGAARQWAHKDIDFWLDQVYDGTGVSRVDPEDVTNKGSMTLQAFLMTYQRTIASADRKRILWGSQGMCRLFLKLFRALHNMGLGGFAGIPVKAGDTFPSDFRIGVTWPPYFEPTDEDKQTVTDRTVNQMNNDLLTQDEGINRIGAIEKIPQTDLEEMRQTLVQQAERKRMIPLLDQLRSRRGAKGPVKSGNGKEPEFGSAGNTQDELLTMRQASGTNNFTS